MADALLVGNNLAVLVAAAELGEAGRDVVLVTDGRPPGGHFRGLRVAGTDFDIGMVTLEQLGGGRAGGGGPGPAGDPPPPRDHRTPVGRPPPGPPGRRRAARG